MMNLRQLQLGDIVCHIDNGVKTICMITNIFESSRRLWLSEVAVASEAINPTEGQIYFDGFSRKFEPVPITTAFLRANGFVQQEGILFDEIKSDTDWWVREYPCDGSPIRIGYDPKNYHFRAGNCGNDNCWMSIAVFSVDEFQRALRLCLHNDPNCEMIAKF